MRCKELAIQEHHYAVPRSIVRERDEVIKQGKGTQLELKEMFMKASNHKFSREEVVKAVAEFIVCDDQVSVYRQLLSTEH